VYKKFENSKRLSLEEFSSLIYSFNESGDFTFGTNWYDYVKKALTEEIIQSHIDDLGQALEKSKIDLKGMSVFDIGCGSGLSSLSFERMGAKSIYSIDIDPNSIRAANYTKSNFSKEKNNWTIEEKSVLDGGFEKFDFVYSWGVLHHTGEMWRAIDIAKESVKKGGFLYLALYRSGNRYPQHLALKREFSKQDVSGKIKMLYDYTGGHAKMFYRDARGMNKFHDAMDWLGGLPYEVCDPNDLDNFLSKFGFERTFFKDSGQGGNLIATYRKVK
jgi:2-polyprenyl-6-hydroxyphenyl methylase/3-demethylubiquinone-9 3-methyltransferase